MRKVEEQTTFKLKRSTVKYNYINQGSSDPLAVIVALIISFYRLTSCLILLFCFSSGIQTLPHNAKVHYNYANFLKDSGQHQQAIHHYATALRSD